MKVIVKNCFILLQSHWIEVTVRPVETDKSSTLRAGDLIYSRYLDFDYLE